MASERFQFGDLIDFQGRFEDENEDPVLNATGEIFIRRGSDDNYWNGATWQVARISIAMTEISETNSPGFWRFLFNTTSGEIQDSYIAELVDTSGNSTSKLELLEALVGGSIIEEVERILGLNHENFVMEPLTWNAANQMLTGEVRLYDSKTNTDTDDGSTGLIAKYAITSPHTSLRLDKYTQTLEP